jgi:hypothetical protein
MEQRERLGIRVKWDDTAPGPRRIRRAEANHSTLKALPDPSEPGLIRYFRDLTRSGWELFCWFVPDPDIEMYIFERPKHRSGATQEMRLGADR